jgi:ABC-type polysaccharide/polyol phosphate export permease
MSAQRMLFLTLAIVLGIGIWLSGWNQVHWLLYVPTVMLAFAGITGICPGLNILKKVGFK